MPQPIPDPEKLSSSSILSPTRESDYTREHGATSQGASSEGSDTKVTTDLSSQSHHAKGEAELAAERLYEERIEDEYAKREGGA